MVTNSTNLFREEGLALPTHNIQTPAIPLPNPAPGDTTNPPVTLGPLDAPDHPGPGLSRRPRLQRAVLRNG